MDTKALKETCEVGKWKEVDVRKMVLYNRHNTQTTSYYLLLTKYLARGHKSPADLLNYDAD